MNDPDGAYAKFVENVRAAGQYVQDQAVRKEKIERKIAEVFKLRPEERALRATTSAVSIIPADLARMASFAGMEVPKPSIEHTLTTCDLCGAYGWIGPAQRFHLTFNGGTRTCYWCLTILTEIGAEYSMKHLDFTADEKPRRT